MRIGLYAPFRQVMAVALIGGALLGCTGPAPEPTVAPATATAPPPTATALPPATPTPTTPPTEDASTIFPPVTAADRTLGPADAGVTVLVYCDYQAPPCAPLTQTLLTLFAAQPDALQVVYRNVPLPIYDKATLAAAAAEAAGAQDRFWEMHARLYAEQTLWLDDTVDAFRARLSGYATDLGLDVERFDRELTDNVYAPQVRAARDAANTIRLPDGSTAGLPGVPLMVINQQIWQGPQDEGTLNAVIALELLRARQFDAPEEVIDPLRHYAITLVTERGDVELELFAEEAPLTVNSFVFLAQNDWFDGVTFHRVLPGFVAQAGDPSGTGFGGPGYVVPDEINPSRAFDTEGLLAMANSGPNTNGSQFFITLAPAPDLTGRYTIFGRVVSGMDAVRALTPRDPQAEPNAAPGDKILDVLIKETE